MDDPRWLQLIDRVRSDTPRLIADFTGELRTHEGYLDEITLDDVERTAHHAFELFAARLAGDRGAQEPSPFVASLGRRRARQGVRIERFMEAVRINFRVLWRGLERASRPDLADVLLAHGEQVLDVVERYATEVQGAFLAELESMARQHRTAGERARARLFGGQADSEELERIAEMLRLMPHAEYELLATEAAPAALREDVVQSGGQVFDDDEVAVLLRPRRGPIDWIDADTGLTGGYIGRVRGLGAVGPATVLARDLAARSGNRRAVRLRDEFTALVREAALERVDGFTHELLGAFDELPDEERDRLATTLRAFVRSGSMQRTAEQLFVHRNTVLKRLRVFQEVSGLDVTAPRDAAIALVMLDL